MILTKKQLEEELRRAFIHGQVNAEMMESGLERDETEDYVSSSMIRLLSDLKQMKYEVRSKPFGKCTDYEVFETSTGFSLYCGSLLDCYRFIILILKGQDYV